MRILIACDKFKGTLTAAEVSQALAGPLASAGHTIRTVPIADGGDGTVAAAISAGFTPQNTRVHGPIAPTAANAPGTASSAATTDAVWARRDSEAIIELAEASGLALITPTPQSALHATSRGTGELIRAALDAGCRNITIGIGGSACTDGGAGLLQALGARLLTADGTDIADGGAALRTLDSADLSPVRTLLDTHRATLTTASDVENPLLGTNGAAAIYGPQKGAGPAELRTLEDGLRRWAGLVDPEQQLRDRPGAGAAGGVGFGLMAVGAQLLSGAAFVLEFAGFEAALAEADLVITGEGRFDAQTLTGKGPGAVLTTASEADVPVWVVCGSSELTAATGITGNAEPVGIAGVIALKDFAPLQQALSDPVPLLEAAARRLASLI